MRAQEFREMQGDEFFDPAEIRRQRNQSEGSRSIVIDMHPHDFLKMAEEGFDRYKMDRVTSAIAAGAKLHDVPLLGFMHDGEGTAVVVMHEGRHRARALFEKGVTKMPVLFHAIEGGGGKTIRWQKVNQPGYDYYDDVWPVVLIGEDRRHTIPFPVPRSQQLTETAAANDVFWHGSVNIFDITQVDPLTHFGSRMAAIHRIYSKTTEIMGKPGYSVGMLYPVRLNIRNPLMIRDEKGLKHSPYKLVDMLHYTCKAITAEERSAIMAKQCSPEAIVEVLRRKGYDGLVYRNVIEDPGHLSYVIFDRSQVIPAGQPEPYASRSQMHESANMPKPFKAEFPYGLPGDGLRRSAHPKKATCVAYYRGVDPELLASIRPGNALRKSPEKMSELIQDMIENGYRGGPGQRIIVYVDADGSSRVGEGNHRLAAARKAKVLVEVEIRYLGNSDLEHLIWPFDFHDPTIRVISD